MVYLVIGKNQEQAATTNGWGDFARWCDPLEMPETKKLVEDGISEKPMAVAEEIADMLEENPPRADVAHTATGIMDFCEEHGEGEVVVATSGVETENS